MNLIEVSILLLLCFLCVYVLVDRVCRCIEHCAMTNAFRKSNFIPDNFKKSTEVVKSCGKEN